jgi:hypothetical protein
VQDGRKPYIDLKDGDLKVQDGSIKDKREPEKEQVIRLLECKAVVELSTGCGRWCGIQYGGWIYPI